MNKHFCIAFAANTGYIQHLSAALKSMLENNPDASFTVYLINSMIRARDYAKLERVGHPYACTIINTVIPDSCFRNLVLTHHYSREIYYRLLIPELIPESRILYLDSDIIVRGKLDGIYFQELGEHCVCAVEDPFFNRHGELNMRSDAKYFNSGVMLINTVRWLDTRLHRRAIDFIEKHAAILQFPDQDALNALLNGQWKRMPLKYNLSMTMEGDYEQDFPSFGKNELRDAKENPVIIHYTGGSKPWHLKNTHPHKKLYWKYLRMTPYRYAIPTELQPANLAKAVIPAPVKKKMRVLTETRGS